MGKFKDLTGQRFGYLTVIKRAEDYVLPKGRKCVRWLCKCDCGNDVVVFANNIGKTTLSCGCFAKENMSKVKKKYNTYDLSGEFGIGYTSKGEEFYFDLEDYDKIKDYCWLLASDGYVASAKGVLFHNIVMGDKSIDHKNHKKYDNRKSNLRKVSASQNQMNASRRSDNTSGITGVSWNKTKEKWTAYIIVNGIQEYLGSFYNKEDAVKARKIAEEKRFGEYSYDNSIGCRIK